MDLYEALALRAGTEHSFISITGGGGKTTLMTGFASYLRGVGKKVLMTTTTKIRSPLVQDYGADRIFSDDSVLSSVPHEPCAVLYAVEDGSTGKWQCPPLENLDVLKCVYDVVLCEADGGRGLPLKVHTQRDPVVPPFCTYTVSVMGLWGIGCSARDVAFGEEADVPVDLAYLQRYLHDAEGLLKGSITGRRALVFNGAEESLAEYGLVRNLDYPSDVFACTACVREGVLYEQLH